MELDILQIIIGILSIIITIWFGSIFVKNMNLKKENEELKGQVNELKEELKKEKRKTIKADLPENYRDIKNDKDLIAYAKTNDDVTEIKILGINAVGPVHSAREEIKGCLEKGKHVKILLLNPYSTEFIDRIRNVECLCNSITEDYQSHLERMLSEWYATIYNLKNIEKNVHDINIKDLLQVRMREEKPTFAFTAIETANHQGIALINEYPSKGRGIQGTQRMSCEIIINQKSDYTSCIEQFEKSWENAKDVPFFIRVR